MRKTRISRLFQFFMAVSANVLPAEQEQARKHRNVPDGIVYEDLLVLGAMPPRIHYSDDGFQGSWCPFGDDILKEQCELLK
jgi:hypothetical protein